MSAGNALSHAQTNRFKPNSIAFARWNANPTHSATYSATGCNNDSGNKTSNQITPREAIRMTP